MESRQEEVIGFRDAMIEKIEEIFKKHYKLKPEETIENIIEKIIVKDYKLAPDSEKVGETVKKVIEKDYEKLRKVAPALIIKLRQLITSIHTLFISLDDQFKKRNAVLQKQLDIRLLAAYINKDIKELIQSMVNHVVSESADIEETFVTQVLGSLYKIKTQWNELLTLKENYDAEYTAYSSSTMSKSSLTDFESSLLQVKDQILKLTTCPTKFIIYPSGRKLYAEMREMFLKDWEIYNDGLQMYKKVFDEDNKHLPRNSTKWDIEGRDIFKSDIEGCQLNVERLFTHPKMVKLVALLDEKLRDEKSEPKLDVKERKPDTFSTTTESSQSHNLFAPRPTSMHQVVLKESGNHLEGKQKAGVSKENIQNPKESSPILRPNSVSTFSVTHFKGEETVTNPGEHLQQLEERLEASKKKLERLMNNKKLSIDIDAKIEKATKETSSALRLNG